MTIPLAKPVFDDEMKDAAIHALQNEKFVMGESVFKFEEEFAKFCSVKRAVSTSSGTFALQLSLQALGVGSKDQVVTTPFSFVATANSAYCAGATPVFADCEMDSCNLGPSQARERLLEKKRVLLPVHLYGYPAHMDPLLDAAGHDGVVVEDCCQAHGAEYNGKKVGSIGAVGCFSFYPAKNMTVGGDGGMAVTNDDDVANKIAKLRDCGRISHYEHDTIGVTARLNTVNAAIGRVQLRRLAGWNESRRKTAKLYDKLLSGVDGLKLPAGESNKILPVYHLYVVRTQMRDELKAYLEGNGIQCGVHYPIPIHLQPIYRKLYGYKEGDYPVAETLSKQVLSLPMYPDLQENDVERVSEKIREFFGQ